jgi:surfactin synthase thioesterase subunit
LGAQRSWVLFPYGGSSGIALRALARALPEEDSVHLVIPPGRGMRTGEAAHRTVEQLAHEVCQDLQEFPSGREIVLFGHSVGSLHAFEASLRMTGSARLSVVVSASPAPGTRLPVRASELDDVAFLKYVVSLNGIPTEILSDPDLVDLFLPAIRADFGAGEEYVGRTSVTPWPIVVLCGTHDRALAPSEAAEWSRHTSSSCQVISIPGDHFFVNSAAELVAQRLTQELAATRSA